MTFMKDNWARREEVGHAMAFERVRSGMAMPVSLPQLLPVYDSGVPWGGSVLLGRQEILGIQVPSVQNNFYANVAYSGPLHQKVQRFNTSSGKAGPRGSSHFVRPLCLSHVQQWMGQSVPSPSLSFCFSLSLSAPSSSAMASFLSRLLPCHGQMVSSPSRCARRR